MDSMVVSNEMIRLFTIIIIGYLVKKARFVTVDFQKKLSSFILDVTMPLLIISSASGADSREAGSRVPLTFLIAVLVFIILPFVGELLTRLLRVSKDERRVYKFMTIFSNLSFMGFPVIASIYGTDAVIYAVIFNLVFNLVQFTYGVMLFKGDRPSFSLRVFLTPVIISSVLGIIIFIIGFQIRGPLAAAFQSVGGITTPMAMLVIGFSLADIPLKDSFSDVRLYLFTVMKQILLPVAAYFLLNVFIQDELILGISVIIIAMPVATMAVILANQYDRQVSLATRGVFLTTLASVATIPVITRLLLL